jgi:acetoacetyl-CoA synthetase
MSTRRRSPFVLIKPGTANTPLILAHGLDGLASFSCLAKQIRTAHPIYGIQAKGVDGLEAPFERVEDMAAFYLDSLRELQPKGPYLLVGYSFGGLVALEMAQQLSENQNEVALLALLDTFPHPRFMSPSHRLPLFFKRMRSHVSQVRQRSLRGVFSYFVSGLKRRLHLPGALHESQRPAETAGLSFAATALRRVNQKAYLAYASYRPRFYRGQVRFVATDSQTFFPGDPAEIWGDLAGQFEVEVIPGDHLNIVSSGSEALAAALTRYIGEVTVQPVTRHICAGKD